MDGHDAAPSGCDVATVPRTLQPICTVRRRPAAVLIAVALAAAAMLACALPAGARAAAPQPPTYTCTPAPSDCSGWYRQPVTIEWSGLSGWNNTYGCNTRTFTNDTAGSVAQCQVDKGSTSYTEKVTIRVDQTPPDVVAVPSRPPDHANWYRSPVSVTFQGTDHTSGIAACDKAGYAGPDTAGTVLTGTCRDVAGNVATPLSFPVHYDSTPPVVKLSAAAGDREVDLRWTATGASVVVLTRDGGGIFGGLGSAFADRSVRNRHCYQYTLLAVDPAGNLGRASLTVRPRPHLIAPRYRHRFRRPPVLSWTPVRGARYYNVQVYRHGHEVLSAWPAHAHLQLRRHWRLRGRRERLRRGTYRWYVWPGRGARAASRYGTMIGTRRFRIR